MPFCQNCGTQYDNNAKYCPTCGVEINNPVQSANNASSAPAAAVPMSSEEQDIAQNKVFAILAYFNLLVLVPIFAAPKSKFAKFHANIGLNLCIAEWIVIILCELLKLPFKEKVWGIVVGYSAGYWVFTVIEWLLIVGIAVFAILGIVSACQGKMKEMPLFSKIKILK